MPKCYQVLRYIHVIIGYDCMTPPFQVTSDRKIAQVLVYIVINIARHIMSSDPPSASLSLRKQNRNKSEQEADDGAAISDSICSI